MLKYEILKYSLGDLYHIRFFPTPLKYGLESFQGRTFLDSVECIVATVTAEMLLD